jgi:RNA polymerase sigma-70 factor (ECF subfamily)
METLAARVVGRGRELTDEEIVARVRAGEKGLFEVIMRRYNRRLYRAARAIVGPDEAEDVIQEAYVRAYAHLDQFTGRARFSTWLTRIAVYEAFGRVRRAGRLADAGAIEETMAPSPSGGPENRTARRELAGILERAIEALPVVYRTTFVMRVVEEMSTSETAVCLEIPEETVKTRLHRARRLLRDALARQVDGAVHEVFDFGLVRCDRLVARVLARIAALEPQPPAGCRGREDGGDA